MNNALIIRDFDDPSYDPFNAAERMAGAGVVTNIFPELAKLRAAAPVHELDIRTYLGTAPDKGVLDRRKFVILGHKEVNQVLGDHAKFSNTIFELSLGVSFGRPITVMDPPEHRGYRMLFQKGFSPGIIATWSKEIIPSLVDRLIDKFATKARVDLYKEFALPFPFSFISELLQLPDADRTTFQKLAFSQTTVRFDREHGIEGGNKLKAYLSELVAIRRSNPLGENDFIATLANAEVSGERLPEEILISFLRQLMNAGGDSVHAGFSNVLSSLLLHPEQLEAVRKDRSLIPAAIDEGLRWQPPIMMVDRTPTTDVEIGGLLVRPGDCINVMIGSANRDGLVYENPDDYNIRRKPIRNVAFGFGVHVCIGQHLARLEMTTALNALLDRLPDLKLDPERPPPVIRGVTTRKPSEIAVVFG